VIVVSPSEVAAAELAVWVGERLAGYTTPRTIESPSGPRRRR